jgi:protein AATF/BFR2
MTDLLEQSIMQASGNYFEGRIYSRSNQSFSKSKIRKPEQISLGPQYAGSRISREALLDDDSDGQFSQPDSYTGGKEKAYADPNGSELDIEDEDVDIDSDAAFGESDSEKFEEFAFRGSGKPRDYKEVTVRPKAADFMANNSDVDGKLENGKSGSNDSDEDLLDTAEQHSNDSDDEIFSTARQYPSEKSDESVASSRSQSVDMILNTKDDNSDDDSDDEKVAEESQEENTDDEKAHLDEIDDEDSDDDEKSRRAELRKIMNEEQQTVVATISQAAKADVDKGNAVKEQRKAFDSLLGVRMVLQKALVATNSMTVIEDKEGEENQPYEAAEVAAVKLWNTLDSLREELSKAKTGSKPSKKRKRGVDLSTPSNVMWEMMQRSEVEMIDVRQTTLEKWSAKVRGTTALPLTRKLNPTTTQSITSVLQDQLASSDHLVRRTKIPRSCAPIQRDQKLSEDPNIYDDGNFYQLLLKELVDQRRVESLNVPAAAANGNALQWTAVKEAKTKKIVDTKASKGRKMRFTVHEKLQNFMAPEDRGSWEPHAIDRFFGTLLGQKMTLGEDVQDEEVEEDAMIIEEEGLKLFRS